MADVLAVAASNLVSPAILAFLLGGLAGFLRSDLEIPEAIAKGLSIYLMLAIGLKGGASLASSDAGMSILPGLIAAVLLSFLIPYIAFFLLRMTTRFLHDRFRGRLCPLRVREYRDLCHSHSVSDQSRHHL